jgi:hypothetical protein
LPLVVCEGAEDPDLFQEALTACLKPRPSKANSFVDPERFLRPFFDAFNHRSWARFAIYKGSFAV